MSTRMINLSIRYPSVSLSPTISRNEKVEQHIRKKIHKPNVLRFWVEGGVIFLYVGSILILIILPTLSSSLHYIDNLLNT